MVLLKKKLPLALAGAAYICGGLFSPGSMSQEATRVLEEIIVTAQKRAESLQDVPISIIAVAGEDMRDAGIQKMEQLAASVPNLHVGEGFGTDQMYIRGIGSGVQFGFEQSVGTVIDGIYYGRSRFSRVAFLDVERVEVLKGPQGALLGKNTTGGAINITSTRPTDEFEAWLAPRYEFEGSEGYTIEGAISGPLSDTLSGRLALRVDDLDGYMENTFTGQDNQSVDDYAGRASLLWDASEDVEVFASYSRGELDRFGRNIEVNGCTDEYRNILAAAQKSQYEDCKLDWKRSSDSLFGYAADDDTAGGGDGVIDQFGPEESQDTEFDIAGLTLNWETELGTFTSVTGWAQYDYHEWQDGDRGPIDTRSFQFIEDYEQFNQEFRLTGNADRFDYIVGFFYQDADQSNVVNLNFQGAAGTAVTPGFPPPSPLSTYIYSDQNTETLAVFGQISWHLSDVLDVVIGARYTEEDKEINQFQDLTPLLQQGSAFSEVYNVDKGRTESNVSPTLALEWRPDDDSMYYASYRAGFKGGGYDFLLNGLVVDPEENGEFEEEEVSAFELGAKLTLLDGAMQLNAAAFYTEYDDLQLGTLVSATSATFVVGNAAAAISQGVEFDLKWRATDYLTVSMVGAYLDANYDDYPGAPCWLGQTESQGCTSSGTGSTQDLEDAPLLYSPEWSGHLGIEYVWPLSSGLELVTSAGVTYSDEFQSNENNDPGSIQDSYTKYDASIKLTDGDRWELALVGRNLSDETTASRTTDLPLTTGGGNHFSIVDPPRQLMIQGRYNF
jgi:outer membrane receptor protein involved in Fe transport